MDSEFLFVHSCDLDRNVQLRIASLEGSASLLEKSYRVTGCNFFVTVSVSWFLWLPPSICLANDMRLLPEQEQVRYRGIGTGGYHTPAILRFS